MNRKRLYIRIDKYKTWFTAVKGNRFCSMMIYHTKQKYMNIIISFSMFVIYIELVISKLVFYYLDASRIVS
jgi:hypothetical protein